MIKLPDVNTIYFDCDDTLVMHRESLSLEVYERDAIPIWIHNYQAFVVPHQKHIKLLKECKASGKVIVVWSQGGSDWAEVVVDVLGLREFVDLCVCKPHWFVDDLMSFQFMPESSRIYKKYDGCSDSSD